MVIGTACLPVDVQCLFVCFSLLKDLSFDLEFEQN